MNKLPKVSIIIRTKMRRDGLLPVDKIFSQSYKNFEVILADNCSKIKH